MFYAVTMCDASVMHLEIVPVMVPDLKKKKVLEKNLRTTYQSNDKQLSLAGSQK